MDNDDDDDDDRSHMNGGDELIGGVDHRHKHRHRHHRRHQSEAMATPRHHQSPSVEYVIICHKFQTIYTEVSSSSPLLLLLLLSL